MTNKERFQQYMSDELNSTHHAIWRGLNGKSMVNKVSILKFFSEVKPFDGITVKNTLGFYNKMTDIAEQYVRWALEVLHEEEDIDARLNRELRNFFVGYIGERFFLYFLQQEKSIYIKSEKQIYTFDYVAPRIFDEQDFGVDLTGQATGNDGVVKDCAFQVKFWNPYIASGDTQMTNKIFSEIFADAVSNGIINPTEDKNIFVCWLGDASKVSEWARLNTKLYKHIVFIDRDVLKDNIDNKRPNFWENFISSLS